MGITMGITSGLLEDSMNCIQDLEAKLETALPTPVLFSRYCASDDKIRFYTKFSSEPVFKIFWESIAPSAS
ncbi:zinc finger protein 502-like isoform X2 [Labeo rohita]|uniref:Zinc finger protein 502-like isoform X2 n=1 Tax=Labeo rohita TaxID=84645 RepID=A0A498M1I0_LABRO|nr:zinc finger protein 502-like isoform X2 [Labeo rohita]